LRPLLALVPLALSLASCARPAATTGDPSRPLELLVVTEPETLDPRFATEAVGLRVSRLLHAGLTRLDPETSAPVPYLAESWRWDDPLTLRVTLRPGLHFHEGAPFESADVAATLAAFASPQVASRHARIVEPIARVETDGPLAVIVHLSRPHATLLSDLELPILRRDQAARPASAGDDLDGLGPYRLTRRTTGDLHLEPTTGGAMDAHHAVEVRTVHDENARALRLESGAADVAVNAVSPTLLPAFDHAPVQIVARAGANLTYLLTRSDEGPLADVRVRQAIALGIDRQLLAQTLLGGHATVAGSLFPPGHWAHGSTEPGAFTRDVPRARALLAEAGVGGGLSLDLLTSTDRLRRSLATAMAQELEEIGLHVTVVPLELGTLLARLTAGDFQLGALQIPELAEPNVLRVFLDSASIPPNGANRGRVRDPEIDRLLDEGDRRTDLAARQPIYAQLDARLFDRLWIVPLWHEDQVALVSPRASGFVPSREGRLLGLAAIP
jgi:peptide/nickel transport system substrate-binding protein